MIENLKIGSLISFMDNKTPMPRMGRIESFADGGVNIAVYNLARQKNIEYVANDSILEILLPSSNKAKAWKQLEKDLGHG